MIISFSGIDSSGKGTQINSLSTYLSELSINSKILWARPGYTPLFVFIKKTFFRKAKFSNSDLHVRKNKVLSSKLLSCLWLNVSLLDLLLYWGFYYRLAAINSVVIADRYILDAFVDLSFQFPDKDISNLFLFKVLRFIAPSPKCSFFLDLQPEVSIARQFTKNDKYPVDVKTLKTIYDLYFSELNNNFYNYYKIDAALPVIEIRNVIRTRMDCFL